MLNTVILGSCNSRALFNYDILKNSVNVKFYAFQINMFNIIAKGLGISEAEINKIPIEQFLRKNFFIDVNKTIKSNLESTDFDCLVIDLYTLISNTLLITKCNEKVYVNNNKLWEIEKYINSGNLDGVSCCKFFYNQIPEIDIKKGLDTLANYLNTSCAGKKIIIINPVFTTNYLNIKNEIVCYNDNQKQEIISKQSFLDKWTFYLNEQVIGSKILKLSNDLNYAVYAEGCDIGSVPNFTHRPKYLEIESSYKLYDLLFDTHTNYNEIEKIEKQFDRLNNQMCYFNGTIKRLDNGIYSSINNVFRNIIDLNKHIVIISAKDECSRYLHKFYVRSMVGLTKPVSYRQSYVAIIDKMRKTNIEEVSSEKIEYKTKIKGKKFKS